jgi:hypothetical protein
MEHNRYPKILGNVGQENAEHDHDDDPYSNTIQNTPRQNGIGSRASESWQQDKIIPEEGQENLGTKIVTIYKDQVVTVGNYLSCTSLSRMGVLDEGMWSVFKLRTL